MAAFAETEIIEREGQPSDYSRTDKEKYLRFVRALDNLPLLRQLIGGSIDRTNGSLTNHQERQHSTGSAVFLAFCRAMGEASTPDPDIPLRGFWIPPEQTRQMVDDDGPEPDARRVAAGLVLPRVLTKDIAFPRPGGGHIIGSAGEQLTLEVVQIVDFVGDVAVKQYGLFPYGNIGGAAIGNQLAAREAGESWPPTPFEEVAG